MKAYQCHKIVHAAKITAIDITPQNRQYILSLEEDPGNRTHPVRYVDRWWFEKHLPHIGGYFLQYEDGYQSFSPAKAFEEGYTLIRG